MPAIVFQRAQPVCEHHYESHARIAGVDNEGVHFGWWLVLVFGAHKLHASRRDLCTQTAALNPEPQTLNPTSPCLLHTGLLSMEHAP